MDIKNNYAVILAGNKAAIEVFELMLSHVDIVPMRENTIKAHEMILASMAATKKMFDKNFPNSPEELAALPNGNEKFFMKFLVENPEQVENNEIKLLAYVAKVAKTMKGLSKEMLSAAGTAMFNLSERKLSVDECRVLKTFVNAVRNYAFFAPEQEAVEFCKSELFKWAASY